MGGEETPGHAGISIGGGLFSAAKGGGKIRLSFFTTIPPDSGSSTTSFTIRPKGSMTRLIYNNDKQDPSQELFNRCYFYKSLIFVPWCEIVRVEISDACKVAKAQRNAKKGDSQMYKEFLVVCLCARAILVFLLS
ncbi:MAG: hypothetical protein EHM72_19050 [Calditrichaeota bacterium]|nr:MAG: hypothetical protein EHM72_19050 [Calditrichota bacterium]